MNLPTAGGSGNLGRFAVNALGAGIGFTLAVNYVLPSIPANIRQTDFFMGIGVQELVLGAGALLGAMALNMAYNRIAA